MLKAGGAGDGRGDGRALDEPRERDARGRGAQTRGDFVERLEDTQAALVGYSVFSHFSGEVIAATTAVAAGAILAMLADTMMPEAFEEAHDLAGLITVAGFLAAFVLTKLGER